MKHLVVSGFLLGASLLAAPCLCTAQDLFRETIAPILQRHCLSCHNDKEHKGDFSLQSYESAFEGGYIESGDADASYLLELIKAVDGKAQMPKNADPLAESDIQAIKDWIESGAVWPDGYRLSEPQVADLSWWSLEPLIRPAVPVFDEPNETVSEPGRLSIRTPVDAFIQKSLDEKGLAASPDADRRTLIRRVYFDLIGLPPNPAEIEAFLADDRADAWEQLVDRLLDSPQYGERWARHWLDVVHYADTHGYDKDKPRPNAWPYRDYVIRSFNEDKPYSRFVTEQIAGDALDPQTPDGIIATGFIAAGPWDLIGHEEVPESKIDGQVARNLDRDDMVTSTLNTFCSMTVQCARCHNHKFDPVTQEHYYSLQSVFAALDRADRAYDIDPHVASRREELKSELVVFDAEHELLIQELAELEKNHAKLVERIITDDLRMRTEANRRNASAIEESLAVLPAQQLVYCGTVHYGSGNFVGTGNSEGKPRPIHVLHRGDVLSARDEVQPGVVPIIDGLDWQFNLPNSHIESDRRLALAQWLVRDDNPLTWRSIVNRVWQFHFGRGIVDTPNDFGRMGKLPSHRELLDWLAVEFRDNGQSIKELHRLIVRSSVYRQTSGDIEANHKIDSENVFLWRMNRRRLTAEDIRDSVLAISGKLDQKMYGPGFQLFEVEQPEHSPHYQYEKHDPDVADSHRRSVYRFVVRSQPDPFMTTLDCADSSQSVAKRDETTTALQALALLNNPFMLRMSEHFASRLRSEADDPFQQLEIAWNLVTGTVASKETISMLLDYTKVHGLENTCRVLFNLNEFVFVD